MNDLPEIYRADDHRDFDLFPVALYVRTLESSGPLNGKYVYDWTEQQVDPATGAYSDAVQARQGTYSVNGVGPLLEINNVAVSITANPPTYVWCRLKGIVSGDLCWEFLAPRVATGSGSQESGSQGSGVSPGSGSSGCLSAINGVPFSQINGYQSGVYQFFGHDPNGCAIWITPDQCLTG